jgi:hypothetical protein
MESICFAIRGNPLERRRQKSGDSNAAGWRASQFERARNFKNVKFHMRKQKQREKPQTLDLPAVMDTNVVFLRPFETT